jgi:hypothetical protein
MGLKDRLLQAKCKVGAHSGEWKQLAAGSCDEQRTCVNCGAISNRTDHHLSDWAYTDDPAAPACTRERHCQRCPVAQQEVKHTMEWRAMDRYRDPCRQTHVCTQCGLTEGTTKMNHRWDSGEFTDGARMVVFTCKVCRAEELRNKMLYPSSSRGSLTGSHRSVLNSLPLHGPSRAWLPSGSSRRRPCGRSRRGP